MEQYIPKSAVVAEIERLDNYWHLSKSTSGQAFVESLFSFLDTLGAKEVDLEEEIDRWQGCEAFPEGVGITPLPKAMEIVERTAKHFFELGVNKAQKGE
jgi:hypothetical protein